MTEGISQEAREAAQVLTTYLSIRGLKDGQVERSLQSLINSAIERCADVAAETANEASAHPEYNLACWDVEAAIRQMKGSTNV